MKFRTAMWMAVVCLCAALGTLQLTAQDSSELKVKHHKYRVLEIGTFGGPHSQVNFGSVVINRDGTVGAGASTSIPDPQCTFDFPFCFIFHALKYRNGVPTDLGTLPGGGNSFSVAINSPGAIAGVSENGLIDPVTGIAVFVGTLWNHHQITNLGTLGGSFSLADSINDRGEVGGGAENAIPDPDNFGGALTGLPSPTQWHATLWRNGIPMDLGTLGTGPDSFGTVNDRGQVAGNSYTNSIVNPETGIPTIDPFFWEHGRMVDIGTLGGVLGSASWLNNRGQVVGQSDLAGDLTHHPFSWRRGVLTDIGTFGGDNGTAVWVNDVGSVVGEADFAGNEIHHAFLWKKNRKLRDLKPTGSAACSNAFSINSSDQVVGNSTDCHGTGLGATLWDHGSTVDLNSFVDPNSGIFLRESVFINDRGEIAVQGNLANGDDHVFILVPCDHGHAEKGCRDEDNRAMVVRSTTNLTHRTPAHEGQIAPGFGFAQQRRGLNTSPMK